METNQYLLSCLDLLVHVVTSVMANINVFVCPKTINFKKIKAQNMIKCIKLEVLVEVRGRSVIYSTLRTGTSSAQHLNFDPQSPPNVTGVH